MKIKLEKTKVTNPQGLNEILSEIHGHQVYGDWDKNIPSIQDVGNFKKTEVQRKIGDYWGKMMEGYAGDYLAEDLRPLGWNLKNEEIHGREYDCIGRIPDSLDLTAELAVEMYFPQPKIGADAEYYWAPEHSRRMIKNLTMMEAKRKYVLIGIPKGISIDVVSFPHPVIRILYQEHRFKELLTDFREL